VPSTAPRTAFSSCSRSLGHGSIGHLVLRSARRDHASMHLPRRERATLDDVVELLRGIGTTLMKIDSKLEELISYIDGEDDGEAES